MTDADDADLIQRTVQGHLDAYAELTERYGPLAYRVALRLLGNPRDAEDVAREALVAAWRQLAGWRAGVSYPVWLCRIVVRRALDYGSRATRSADLPGDASFQAAEPAQEAGPRVAADAFTAAAVAALPPSQRVAIVLHHFEGLPSAEIARITGSTGPALCSDLLGGRRALTKALVEGSESAVPLAGRVGDIGQGVTNTQARNLPTQKVRRFPPGGV
jgi:RNA polymerase sigma-70 factor (ECF subfamily)